MLTLISRKITLKLIKSKIISKNEENDYVYGYEMIFATLLNMLLILCLGFIFKKEILSLIYLLVFISLRVKTGGYHAKGYGSCFLFSILVFLFFLICVTCFTGKENILYIMLMYVFSILVFYKYSPIINKNKVLDEEQIKKSRKDLFKLVSFWSACSLFFLRFNYIFSVAIIITIFIVAVFVFVIALQDSKEVYADE